MPRSFTVRGNRVVVDADLASHYGVMTKRLNEQVRRNPGRFPGEFVFQLSPEEWSAVKAPAVPKPTGRGKHRKHSPRVFTEPGALMAAHVLHSPRAIEMSIEIVRAVAKLPAKHKPMALDAGASGDSGDF